MRASLILIPALVALGAPAAAQSNPSEPQLQVPPELADPAFAERLSRVTTALSKALLDLRVGEIKAAAEGRQPTPAERKQTVRDVGRIDDKDLERRVAEARPQIEQSVRALQQALPEMMKSFGQVQKSLERAAANMPDPTYPKR
jgi:hypothetical protein